MYFVKHRLDMTRDKEARQEIKDMTVHCLRLRWSI